MSAALIDCALLKTPRLRRLLLLIWRLCHRHRSFLDIPFSQPVEEPPPLLTNMSITATKAEGGRRRLSLLMKEDSSEELKVCFCSGAARGYRRRRKVLVAPPILQSSTLNAQCVARNVQKATMCEMTNISVGATSTSLNLNPVTTEHASSLSVVIKRKPDK